MSLAEFVIPFGLGLIFLCVIERVLNALISLFWSDGGDGKTMRAQLLVKGALNLLSVALNTAAGVLLRCVYLMSWLVLWYALIYCVLSVVHEVYERHPGVLINFFDFYSKRIGPLVHGFFLLPLELLNLILKGVLPFYNGAVWMLRSLISKGLLPILWDHVQLCVEFSVYVMDAMKTFSSSLLGFFWSLGCDDLACLERSNVIDLVTPMSSVRGAALVAARLAGKVCSLISLPVEFVLYPLTDLRFARGLHGVVNAVLHAVVLAPQATYHRCRSSEVGSGDHGVLMCTPDLQPIFDHAVSGLRELGAAGDNWLGVGAAMARRGLTGESEKCARRALEPSKFRGDMLSGAQTVVGLSDWLMASANGSLVFFYGQATTGVTVRAWPGDVDVSFGLAAVSYDEAGDVEVTSVTQGQRPSSRQSTSVLGCKCLDTEVGVVVRCYVVSLGGGYDDADRVFDVKFQDTTWSTSMTCSGVELSVRSVRWPVRRYEGKSVPFGGGRVDFPELDCMSRGTCESVDATIWLVPRCDASRPEMCSDAAVGTSCFPFCLAVRVAGSRNSNPVFLNAEAWRSGKQLLMRDCVLSQGDALATESLTVARSSVTTTVLGDSATVSGAAGGAKLFVSGLGDGSSCVSGSGLSSWVSVNATKADVRSVAPYVRRRGQPFAIAGDTILMEFATADGASKVEVDRLTGDQKDVYSLVSGWAGLPTAPKTMVPIQELTQEERARVVVPLDYVSARVPSTSSRNYVFYAVSPDLRIFQAYLDYCRDGSVLPQVQWMMLSSYSALRVYRVRAYCQEECEVGALAAQYTFEGFSDGRFTSANFPQDCGRRYNASIDAVEYVNEQNVAVIVQVADRTFDPVSRTGVNSTYVTYWLNPQTMSVRLDGMWPVELPSTLSADLCLVGDGVPHLSSIASELGVAGLHVLHRLVGGVLYAPGLIRFWRGGSLCPLDSRGHSVLATCARDVFSMDDFFDSLDAATAIFWGIPGWIAEQLEQGEIVTYSPVSDLLRGFGAYGRGTVGITDVRGGFLSLLNTPLPEQLAGTYALIRQPGALSGAAKVVGAAGSWARYSARFFTVVGAGVAQRIVQDGAVDLGELWNSMVGTLYDERPLFKSAVTDRARSACLGLQVIVGGANPFGRLLHHSCLSSALLLDGMMDVFLRLFVDAPLLKCVCKDSSGKLVAKYAREHCLWRAPQTMQPMLLGMIAAADGLIGGDALLCPSVVAYTRAQVEKSMQPYFSAVMSSLDGLGDLVDYMLIGYDSDAGQCKNFDKNPQVVVIMPEPVDYFQGCGVTTSCRTKCSGPWDFFQDELGRAAQNGEATAGLVVKQQNVDSWFFPEVVVDMISPGKVLAMTSPDLCGVWVCRELEDDCLAVATLAADGNGISVSFFCVPKSPAASAYGTEVQGVNWVGQLQSSEVRQVSFLLADGSSAAVLMESSVVLIERSAETRVVLHKDYVLSLPLMGMYPMYLLDFLAVHDLLLVNLAVRTVVGDEFERDVATIWFHPRDVHDVVTNVKDQFPFVVRPALKLLWKGYAVSEYGTHGEVGRARMLFWPTTPSGSIRRVTFQWTNQTFEVASVEPFAVSQSLLARATMMPREIVLSKRLREDSEVNQLTVYCSSGAVYDWLRQLRLSGSDLTFNSASISNSQVVKANVSVQTRCDGLDCRGCLSSRLRAACSAYQSCAVFRCIGTPVNLKRPLCGVGGTLKSLGSVGVESVHGAWLIFVDVYMILLQLGAVPNLPGVDVNFPDDAFMGNMCAAKDVSVELISVVTSTVNSALHKAQASLGVLSRASAIDNSVNTLLSTSTAAVTGFLNQIALAPVYLLSVGHKIMMCQVSGTLAVVGRRGFEVSIQSARFSATDAISGQCLTKSAEVSAMQTGDATEDKRSSTQAGNVLTFSAGDKVMKRLEPFMHMMDGGLTYLIGVVSKFADVLQATDVKHCVLPDVTLHKTVRCACGDTGLSIDAARKREGIPDFAYWCTGTLSLPNANNRMQIVWNPFSYQELQGIVGKRLDEYVKAASAEVGVPVPNHDVFEKQGVSMFSVLTRCRQNFVNKQWDSAAYVRYDHAMLQREVKGGVTFQVGDVNDGVGDCLIESMERGAGNEACLDSFLRSRNLNDAYWGYSVVNESVGSDLLDACMVFSGPASNKSVDKERRQKFQKCLGGYGDEAVCDLSGFVWSPASSNAVPVAARHVVRTGNGSRLDDAVLERMKRARDLVMSELGKLSDYENKDLQSAVFSAEGDVIHQLLDCVFLGPYARMDYWPVPRCNESERPDCLVGPYWSRDDARGRTRNVDVDSCETEQELPFTCGSPTRKAMVKDFVKQFLEVGANGADLIQHMIRDWLQNQTQLWSDLGGYYCEGGNASDVCGAGYLPDRLRDVSLMLSTKEMVAALRERVGLFFNASMRTSEPWISFLGAAELAKYNWSTSAGSHKVRSHAAFHPASPTQSYGVGEAFSPPTSFASPSLWHACHSALRQVMFTLPANDDGTLVGGVPDFSGGSVDVISEHVKRLVERAYQDSPLYRHYHPRHHPSPSRMCRGSESRDARVARGSVRFSDFSVNGYVMFNAASVSPVPLLGYDAAVLGGSWNGGFSGLNEHLGFLDRASSELWLRGEVNLTTSGEFLLRHGPGGLKIGNLPGVNRSNLGFEVNFTGDLDEILRDGLRESERVRSVESAVLDGCDEHRKSEASLTDEFVDGLFPMAQGVRESGVGSYCLRFAVELALLRVYELAPNVSVVKVVAQKEQVVNWRRKCGTQVQLVGMCNALNLYRDGGFQPYTCLHPWRYAKPPGSNFYVTPDCLVKLGDHFYDPCVCKPHWCAPSNTSIDVDFGELLGSDCTLRFDPRKVVQSVELGWWAEGDSDPRAAQWNDWLEDPLNLLDFDQFQAEILSDGHGVGNAVPGQHWGTAEGFMNQSGLFCDMVADYWPENFEYPVGYHVTVPCDASEAGYRTFDNVFVREDTSVETVMRYVEDQSRGAEWIDSHFGAGGLCRGTNFGFDMYETNTMRVCTRVSDGEDVDVHVPRGEILRNELGIARCSESSKEIPWGDYSFYDYYDASFYSVGTVPNLPSASAMFYPENNEKLLVLGPQHVMNMEGWGGSCQDLAIPNCSGADWRCPPGYVCTASGVCQHPSVECTRHSDCAGEMMCTGMGACVDPVVSFENQLGNESSVRAHTTECAGESFSMVGASHWGYVPDLLEAHGMCSYRHWQEYLYTLEKCNCSVRDTNTCVLDAKTCPYYVFSNQLVNNNWWNNSEPAPTRLKMIPTTCDRDYERFKMAEVEMKSCVPDASRMFLLKPDGTYQQAVSRDVLWKIYDGVNRVVPLRRMPARADVTNGFLGVGKYDKINNCMSVQQCFVGPFTKNGRLSMLTSGVTRANRTLLDSSVYKPDDQFRCGVIGYFHVVKRVCVVDEKVFPLYYVFCNGTQKSVSDKCSSSLKSGSLPSVCDAVQREYSPQYSVIQDVNVPALNAFFNIFKKPLTLAEHLDLVTCVTGIYSVISAPPFDSQGLYYAFAFALYEVPFSWFYQCNVGAGVVVANNLDKKMYACTFYDSKISLSGYTQPQDGKYTEFDNYIFNVRGGYVKQALDAERLRQRGLVLAAWGEAVEQVRSELFVVPSVDLTYPRCSTELRWDLPASTDIKRKLIESFVRNRCTSNLVSKYVQIWNERYKTQYTVRNILSALTVLGGNRTQQSNYLQSNKLLTGLINRFGVSFLTAASEVNALNVEVTPIRLNYNLPALDSAYFASLKSEWKNLLGVLPNDQDLRTKENIQECEASQLKDVYRDASGTLLASEDTDMKSGLTTTVQTCPVYAEGQFGCSYPDIVVSGVRVTLEGNSTGLDKQFDDYVNALYGEVKKRYDLKVATLVSNGSLMEFSMSELNFYKDESSQNFQNFVFDLQNVANYLNNINPDVRTPVMCVAGNQQVDYNTCNDQNFIALRQHVANEYSVRGGIVVPDRSQLNWRVSRRMMTAGAIFSFASTKRDVSKQFLNRLFDSAEVCSASAANREDRMCYFDAVGALGNRTTITPWMSGWWNPFDRCDVEQMDAQSGNTEKIDSYCYYETECPAEKGLSTSTVNYYKYMPNNVECIQRNNQKTRNLNVNPKLLYNLCRHGLEEDSICRHTQGMVGGSDGFPMEDYALHGNLFSLHDFSKVPLGDSSLFGNVLLRRQASDYGFLRFGLSHIGGHQLGLRIVNGSMVVWRMPLKDVMDKTMMAFWDTTDVATWVTAWLAGVVSDDAGYRQGVGSNDYIVGSDARGQPVFGWDCPLRRRAFYTGGVQNFRPHVPSARRSRAIFKDVNGNLYAHPTQFRHDGSVHFGRYKTTNGFCFCPLAEETWPNMCGVPVNVEYQHNCSLFSTLRAIQGSAWGWSHTFRPRNVQYDYKTCTTQVDWPFLNGTLRDGAKISHSDVNSTMWDGASDVENRRCHVLDRMPDFAYVFVSRRLLKPSGVSTLREGVCHTGRAQKWVSEDARCVRVSKGDSYVALRCSDNKNLEVQRPVSLSAKQGFQRTRFFRRRCSQCTPPPTFATRSGAKIKAETSFGVPYRISVERVLASEIRGVLCNSSVNCSGLLNDSAWVKGTFLSTLLKDPRKLFRPEYVGDHFDGESEGYKPRRDNLVTDDALWARQWVHCPTKESLKTGVGCNGTITKHRWRADKVGSCHSTIVSALRGQADPFAATDVCNIDSRLAALCKAIREAQSLIASANCIAGGGAECSLQEFVYNPSTWETSNRAFVHQTVKEYYMRVDGCTADLPCVCGIDEELISLRKNNSAFLRDCSAVPVMTFRDVLLQLRSLIFPVCKMVGTVVDLLFNLVLMMSSSAREAATSRLVLAWARFKQETAVITNVGSDLFFDMLFSTGVLGPWMQKNVMKACNSINYAYNYTANFWCSLVVKKFPLFLSSLRSIGGWIDVGFTVVNDLFGVILNNYIPEAMLDLYSYGYKEYFQSTKYREKQQAYDKRVKGGLVNPEQPKALDDALKNAERSPDNKIMNNAAEGRAGRMKKKTAKSAVQILGILPYLGDVADAGLTTAELLEQYETAEEIRRMMEMFPKSFTLFDFDDFYSAIDKFVEFFNKDFMCFDIDKDVMPLQCTVLNFTEPSKDDVYAMAPRASTCWAEAQEREVGISNLYACTPTSTCCADPLNCDTVSGARLCSFCPMPSVGGVRQFGCNTMLQRCQCGLKDVEVDRCVAQRECGPSASCSLLTSLDDVSFGSLDSCSECSTSSVCLMGSNQVYGQCTCLSNADVKVDLCSEANGAAVNPNPARLCGYTRDLGTVFSWSELSLVRCIYAVRPVCAEVVSESGNVIRMPVCHKVKASQVAYSSRRLLSVEPELTRLQLPSVFLPDDPADDVTADVISEVVTGSAWNHTSAPCSTLAHAYVTGVRLGPVDESTLHSCVYWRTVARQIIKENNLVALRGMDTFLLSASDFASSLGQKGVLRELYENPWVILHSCLYSPWLKPVRAALIASHDPQFLAGMANWSSYLLNLTVRKNLTKLEEVLEDYSGADSNVTEEVLSFVTRRSGRRLLGVWDDVESNVKTLPYYSMAVQQTGNVSRSQYQMISESQWWGSDIFWVKRTDNSSVCPVADVSISNLKYVASVVGMYYSHMSDIHNARVHRYRLRDVWPSFVGSFAEHKSEPPEENFALYYFLKWTGWSMEDVADFFTEPCKKSECFHSNKWTATYMAESLLFCNFEDIMFCKKDRNDLIPSFIFVCLVCIMLTVVLSYVGLTSLSFFVVALIPLMTVWYSSGVSPRCLPMIPTCLLDDVIESVKEILPMKLAIPKFLLTNSSSLKRCDALHFNSWEDPLVYWYCEMGFCSELNNTVVLGTFNFKFGDMHRSSVSADNDAYRMCAWVTLNYVVPVILLVNLALVLTSVILVSLGLIISPIIQLMWRSLIYNHNVILK